MLSSQLSPKIGVEIINILALLQFEFQTDLTACCCLQLGLESYVCPFDNTLQPWLILHNAAEVSQSLSLSTPSKALAKSSKLKYNVLCHSMDCSTLILKAAIWSTQDLPDLQPACSFLNFTFSAVFSRSNMSRGTFLLETDSSLIPL